MIEIKNAVVDGKLVVYLNGRIDTSNAQEVEAKIDSIVKENPGKELVLDGENLKYISSAGLRVVLKLRKTLGSLSVIKLIPDVYEVFELVGFTDLMTIQQA